jgi:hypothetical protein
LCTTVTLPENELICGSFVLVNTVALKLPPTGKLWDPTPGTVQIIVPETEPLADRPVDTCVIGAEPLPEPLQNPSGDDVKPDPWTVKFVAVVVTVKLPNPELKAPRPPLRGSATVPEKSWFPSEVVAWMLMFQNTVGLLDSACAVSCVKTSARTSPRT